MGRIGVAYEDVAQAAQQVQGRGQPPTVDQVRQVLRTGSKTTIARHLKDWRSQQGLIRASDGAIPSELLGLVKGLWDRLRDTLEQKTFDDHQAAEAKITQIQQQLTQAQQQQVALQTHAHTLEENLHQQTQLAQQLQGALVSEQHDKAKMAERITFLEHHRQEQQHELEQLHQLLNHMQHNLEHYQNATLQLRQEQSLILEKQRSEYEQKIAQLQQQLITLQTEKSFEQAQAEQSQRAYEKLQQDYQTLDKTYRGSQQDAQSVLMSYQKLQHDHDQLLQQHQKQIELIETKHQAILELQFQMKSNHDKLTTLEAALPKAEDKIQSLRHDYHFMAQEKANLEGQVKQLQALLPRK